MVAYFLIFDTFLYHQSGLYWHPELVVCLVGRNLVSGSYSGKYVLITLNTVVFMVVHAALLISRGVRVRIHSHSSLIAPATKLSHPYTTE